MTARVTDINEAKLARIRANFAAETPGMLVGFQTVGGSAAFSGEDPTKGPFVSPVGSIPDHSDLGMLFNESQMSTTVFRTSEVVDVRSWRAITLYCRYDFDSVIGGQLIMLPEVSPTGADDDWYAIAVVDATLTQVNPASAGFINAFGQRMIFLGSTFISPNPGAAGTARWKMAFDIEGDWFFRLNAMENIAASPPSVNNDFTVKHRMVR